MKIVPKQSGRLFKCAAAALSVLSAAACWSQGAVAADYNRDIIYQVFTDRFFNGRADNDDPSQSEGLFDGSHKNWRAYWGGDLAGITAKLDYIKGLGATAIWISPVFDNVNKPAVDANGKMYAPYHGYHTRDFMRIEEHFGDPANTFRDFDTLTDAAHKAGLKIFVDIPFNHTSEYNHGDYGALYSSGQFRSDVENDKNKYFNHLPQITDYNNRFQIQYHTLAYLGDLNQENSYIDTYLKLAAQKLRSHGADGTRLDAAKHANWAWEQTLANMFYHQDDHLVMGEWWMTGLNDPLYRDAVKFANKGGISLFDFNLALALRDAFKSGGSGDLTKVAQTIEQEDKDFNDSRELLTFIDNHDMPRFMNLNSDKQALAQALALLFTSRGIPIVYYGTEQYVYDDTNGGEDPYDRVWMSSFDQKSPGYKLVQALSRLRRGNKALMDGAQKTLFVSADAYVFARQAGADLAVVAVNKSHDKPCSISDLKTGLADGQYNNSLDDYLKESGADASNLAGGSLNVVSGLSSLSLPPASVSVWYARAGGDKVAGSANATPWIAAARPPAVASGTQVTLYGEGFGDVAGKVLVGDETIEASAWSDNTIKFSAPHKSLGALAVSVVKGVDGVPPGGKVHDSAGHSNEILLSVVEPKLIPVRFVLNSPPSLAAGEQLFISGNAAYLGAGKTGWDEAAGPMIFSDDDQKYILCVPMPAGKSTELKLLVLDQSGKIVKQESSVHKYQVPAEGCWKQELVWQ